MAKSQNGWPVAAADQMDRAPLVRDVTVPNGVLRGDVAIIFRYVAAAYDRDVQRLVAGTCWGWFVKEISGSSTISNHASGTAVDFNAPQLPMGTPTARLLSAAQIAECRKIVAECDGVIRWGGDYSGRPDAMHWEIVGTPARVMALADKIKEMNVTDWNDKIGEPIGYEPRTFRQAIRDLSNWRDWGWSKIGTKGLVAVPEEGSPLRALEKIPALTAEVERVKAELIDLTTAVEDLRTDLASADIERIDWPRVPTSTLISELSRRADA